MSFNATHHATMLLDEHRLGCFRRAIVSQVKRGSNVVDVGTGTGVLSHFARLQTDQRVFALEYFSSTADIAKKVLAGRNIEVVNIASSKFSPEAELNVLVSEIIGPVGPEENVVETFYDLARRFRSIETFIPNRITMFAQPIYSQLLDKVTGKVWSAFAEVSEPGFDFTDLKAEILMAEATRISHLNLEDATLLDESKELATYHLGRTKNSSFVAEVDFTSTEANACHIYFEADLGGGVKLTSKIGDPITHWRHAYVPRPEGCHKMALAYTNASRKFSIQWR